MKSVWQDISEFRIRVIKDKFWTLIWVLFGKYWSLVQKYWVEYVAQEIEFSKNVWHYVHENIC